MRIFNALFFAAIFPVAAQTPQVPPKMDFAGITLTIRDDARKEIQKDVDALTQSFKHYNIKAERAKTYFPIIEKIFREEKVPDDFKYLALQESALIPDAVSVSNAVGFWQFKDFTAIENGLRVDRDIDERMNIVASSRAAARYIKKNNSFFDNWVYALQAYQMGAGGVMKSVKDTKAGASHMEVTSRTYWYVKRFLAHKVAYEDGVKGKAATEVLTYETTSSRSLADLAREVSVGETELLSYNKWTKSGSIPGDRKYFVLIPLVGKKEDIVLTGPVSSTKIAEPRITPSVGTLRSASKKINGLRTMLALEGDDAASLAARAGIETAKLLRWNDLSSNQPLVAGEFYFLAKKRVRATENFHKALAGEDLWLISQRYGVQLKNLRKYNRLSSGVNTVSAGHMLWLASRKPKTDANADPPENAVAVSNEETFNWSANPEEKKNLENKEMIILKPEVLSGTQEIAKPADSTKILQETVITTDQSVSDTLSQITVRISDLEKKEHIVQPGETLYRIAKIYAIGVMDLVNWNTLDLQLGIKPGQILKLSENQIVTDKNGLPKVTQEVLHEVKSSDTLYSIARQYGVTIKELMDWNAKKDFSLAVGEKLKIFQRQ